MQNEPLILSREEARALDTLAIEQYGIPGIVLMENAGRGIFECLLCYKPKGKVVICCGKGNNGGDGFVLARHLSNAALPVEILLFADPSELRGDARTNYDIVMNMELAVTPVAGEDVQAIVSQFADAEWIVDALFGTGLQGSVQKPFDAVIQSINDAGKKVLAIDIPSGLGCDTGEVLGISVKADVTVSMVGLKLGFQTTEAKPYLGDVHVVDIGISGDRVLSSSS